MRRKQRTSGEHGNQHILKQLVGSLETALEEEADQIDELLDTHLPEEGEVRTKPRRNVGYIIVGAVALVFSIIGIVASVIFLSGTVKDIMNQTALKQEFTGFIYPVVITDPPEFDNNQNIPTATVVSSAIWRIIIGGDIENYRQDQGNMMIVPAVDVEASARSLYGSGFEVVHQSIDNIEVVFEYDEETRSYTVPVRPRLVTYVPQIDNITKVGELYSLTVSYLMPSPLAAAGIEYDNEPVKTVIYSVSRTKNKMTINAIDYAQNYLGVNSY